ncbi:MAG: alkaline shock response membrane anchor protein AmaP, partial [Pontiellaceae bacterium]|nr:alkaline shock response membrane anchor protein AmaP [Pontiellaceae bacterium]
MKKILHLLSGIIIWILFFATGCALVHANILGVEKNVFDLVSFHGWKALFTGILLIFIAMFYLISFGPRRSKDRYIAFDFGDGSVSISTNSILDYIRKLSGEFSTVVSIDPKVRVEKDQISIDLMVNLVA